MVDYNIVCNEIAKRVESGELSSEEAQSIMEKADVMYGDGELLTENYKDSITEKMNDAMVQYNRAQAEAKEHIKKKEYREANIALQKLLTSLKTIREEVKNTKPDSKGAATLIVAKSVAKDAAAGAFVGTILGALADSDEVGAIAATVGLGYALTKTIEKAVTAVNRDGKLDSTAFDAGKQKVIASIDKYIDDVNKTILKIAKNVGKEDSEKKEADESEKTESVDDIEQAFNDIDAYLEGCTEVVTERVSQSEVERRYSKALSEANAHGKSANLYAKAGKYKEAIRELNAKKDMINEVIDVINGDTTGFTGALAGNFIQGIYNLVPSALMEIGRSSDNKAAKAAGAIGSAIALDTSIKTIRGQLSGLKARGMSWDLFNGRKTKIIGSLKTIINITDAQIKYYEKCDRDIKELDEKDSKDEEKDEVTEAVIDAIAERIEAVTEAYLDDKIDEDEYNECMTLLDINNYDCFF